MYIKYVEQAGPQIKRIDVLKIFCPVPYPGPEYPKGVQWDQNFWFQNFLK